jgi:hypothetical protein
MAEPWITLSTYALAMWIVMGFVAVVVLWLAYLRDRAYRKRHHMPSGFVSLTLASIGTVTFAAAAWAAFLTIRRLNGLDAIEWSPQVTIPLLLLALSTPIAAAGVVLYQRYRY